MRQVIEFLIRIALLAVIFFIWGWALNAPLSNLMNLSIIVGGPLLVFPLIWFGRKILDRHPTTSSVAWITTFVHYALGILFGMPIIRAVMTYQDGSGWVLPVPAEIGLALVIITGAAFLLTVVNLALKGLGAPFAIALSRKLAVDWLYAWTRNPMVLAALAFLLSLGIWFQSVLFVLWALILFAPALLFFVKVYEERELEFRFGSLYLEYKSKTPMLFPRRPRGQSGLAMRKVFHKRTIGILLGLIVLSGLLLAIYFLYSAQQPVASPNGMFRNPLNNSGPDPWMTYYDGNYYLATTTWGGPSTGLTMRKASTIADLKSATPQKIWQDSTPERCCNYWAPEFFLLNGPNGPHWYGYYSGGPESCCDNQRIHVIESTGTDPMGPYVYKGQLKDSTDDRSIDASVLQLNGSLYLLFASRVDNNEQRIYIAPMKNPWTLSGDRVLLSAPTYDWEKEVRNINQGPVALQHNGKTFIVYSASYCGGTGYKLGVLSYTGNDPLQTSSWIKSPIPVFQGTDEVFSPGHNTFFKSPDGTEDWIVYHANDSSKGSCDMKRTPRIQKFTWNADGTPNFGSPASVNTDLAVPSGERDPAPTPSR